jgi:hypothetical protein
VTGFDSSHLPAETGLQNLTTDIGKAVTEAVDEVNQVIAPAVEFLLGLFPGYDVVTAAVGTNVTGEELPPGQRVVVGVLGATSLDELGDTAKISIKFSTKIEKQLVKRGWARESIEELVTKPTLTRRSSDIVNRATGNPVTYFYRQDGYYVVIDDITGEVVQISDLTNPGWVDEMTNMPVAPIK